MITYNALKLAINDTYASRDEVLFALIALADLLEEQGENIRAAAFRLMVKDNRFPGWLNTEPHRWEAFWTDRERGCYEAKDLRFISAAQFNRLRAARKDGIWANYPTRLDAYLDLADVMSAQ